MATSPIHGDPLPNSTSTDQVPADLMTYVTAAEKKFVGVFASAAARDGKITTPTPGMVCYLTSPGDFFDYIAGAWRQRGRPQFLNSVGWPNSTVAGTNNIVSASLTLNPQIGPYMAWVALDVRAYFASGSTADVDMQLLQDGTVIKQKNLVANPTHNVDTTVAVSILMSTGGSTTLQGKLVIPAGTTVTTYADSRHSALSAQILPVYA